MNIQPKIESVGPPPDKHAERIVWEMLKYLHAGQQQRWAKARGALRSSQLGSIVGQKRAVARFAKTVGDLALSIELAPAKRGRYTLRLVSWIVYNPLADAALTPGEPLPPAAQLAIIVAYGRGANHNPQWDSALPLVVSRHAMERLAQRANVRTITDLLVSLRELWQAVETRLIQHLRDGGETWPEPPPAGWRLPLPGLNALAVVGRSDNSRRQVVVKTILSADTLSEED
jgi:hypothetical protein